MEPEKIMEPVVILLRRDYIDIMYRYFTGMTGHSFRGKEILGELMNAELFGGFDTKTCQDFINWFTNIDSSGKTYYRHKFETLCESDSFFRLCQDLYLHRYRIVSRRNIISLKSLDGVATSVDMRVVAAESEVLSAFTDRGGGRRLVEGDEIPLKNLSGKIVSEITHFMNKKHDFSRELKNLIINYKGWCTQYLKLNRTMLSDLNEAAEFLGIKSLFKLTGRAVMELGEKNYGGDNRVVRETFIFRNALIPCGWG